MKICKRTLLFASVVMAIVLSCLTSRVWADIFEDPALIAHWLLDEGSGQVAYDSSSNGLDLQLGRSSGADGDDPSWGERGVEFQAGNYITSVVDEDILDFNADDPFTVAAWVKRPEGALYGIVIGKSENEGPDYRGWYVAMRDNDEQMDFIIRETQSDNSRILVRTFPVLPAFQDWTHIAVTYDGSADGKGVVFYVNALQILSFVSNDALNPGDITANDVPFNIGGREDVGTYVGGVDDAAIWGRALTWDEVGETAGISWVPGDANRDGKVDEADAAILANNWLISTEADYRSKGDFNEDGVVNDVDATLLATNWHYGVAPENASVPEPGIFTLLLGGVFGIVICLRRYWRI